ncbi:hypothetical protein HY837_02805 [archaeon]|nr:hypothetical protein [archaeon]
MEQQKKRHNPEITEEDRAVKAFDAQPRSDFPLTIDEAVEKAETETKQVVERGEEAFRDEFNHLIWKVFGEDVKIRAVNRHLIYTCYDIDKLGKRVSPKDNWDLYKKVEGWHEFLIERTHEQYVSIQPDPMGSNFGIFSDGSFHPIRVTAHTPKALKQAKVFVVAYEKFTGQKVTLVRECRDEEEMKEQLGETVEDKVEEPSPTEVWKQVMKDSTINSTNFISGPLKNFSIYFMKGGLCFYMFPTISRKFDTDPFINKDRSPFDTAHSAGAFTGILSSIICGTILGARNHEFVLIPLATNALSIGYEQVRDMYNTTKKKLAKK